MPVRVFLIEGREIVRQGIKAMLDNERSILLVGKAVNDTEALEKLQNLQPDVILLNMNIPVAAALEFTRRIKKKYPTIRLLILTAHDHESSLIRLLQEGADGYVHKNPSKNELINAIEKVNAEGAYLRPEFISDSAAKQKSKQEPGSAINLSERESQVLNLIAQGMTNIEMAKKLFTSVRTIETRRKKLLDKTGTVNTATLIRYAVLNGLVK